LKGGGGEEGLEWEGLEVLDFLGAMVRFDDCDGAVLRFGDEVSP
jgi:hypothetical protein